MKLAILATLLLLTACTSGLSPEEIEARVLEANSGINYYKISSDIDMTSEAQGQTIDMQITMNGEIDREAKKGHISSKTSMALGGFETNIDQETYVVDDYIYSQVLNNWIKIPNEQSWEEQDQAGEYAELLKSGDMKIKGTETIDGTEYYVVELTLSNEYLQDYLSASSSEGMTEVSFSDYDVTFYINTETFVIERNSGSLSISQQVLGETMNLDMEIETVIHDINVPVSIEIPAEALNAQEMDDNFIGSY